MSINAAHDEEFLDLLQKSGCQGVLVGFESLNPENLKKMNKGFNMMGGGYEKALANLRKYNIRLYITFVFGYDEDTPESFSESVEFAKEHNFYITAFTFNAGIWASCSKHTTCRRVYWTRYISFNNSMIFNLRWHF